MGKTEKSKECWRERRKKIKHKCARPFIFAEWICEQVSYFLGRWAFLDILGHAGRLAILFAVVSYIMGAAERQRQAEDQRKARQYQAWQVINIAQGKPGGGGRKDALEDLNRDKVSLAYVDVSEAWLPELNLENAILYRANFNKAVLSGANLSGANLHSVVLIEADLNSANLAEANLTWARLSEAGLSDVDLSGANCNCADFSFARLDGADLKDIQNWTEVKSIENANIYGVKNAPAGFIKWAETQGAVKRQIKDHQEWLDFIREKKKK